MKLKFNWKAVLKFTVMIGIIVGALGFSAAFADPGDDTGIGKIANNISGSFSSLGKLVIAIAYLAGIAFVMAAIFKFKQHKDNPTQIPLGTPIAMLAIGIVLVFLGGLFGPAGQTLLGSNADTYAGGDQGKAYDELPGQKS